MIKSTPRALDVKKIKEGTSNKVVKLNSYNVRVRGDRDS